MLIVRFGLDRKKKNSLNDKKSECVIVRTRDETYYFYWLHNVQMLLCNRFMFHVAAAFFCLCKVWSKEKTTFTCWGAFRSSRGSRGEITSNKLTQKMFVTSTGAVVRSWLCPDPLVTFFLTPRSLDRRPFRENEIRQTHWRMHSNSRDN